MVQDIVQEVLAKMQIQEAPTGKHGVFKDMNEAIEAAKKAQQTVKKCPWIREKRFFPLFGKKSVKMQRPWLVWVWKKPEWEMWEIKS